MRHISDTHVEEKVEENKKLFNRFLYLNWLMEPGELLAVTGDVQNGDELDAEALEEPIDLIVAVRVV